MYWLSSVAVAVRPVIARVFSSTVTPPMVSEPPLSTRIAPPDLT
jgi:hypothetical protein